MLTDSLLSLFRARIFRSSAKKQEKGGGIILRVGRSLKGHLKGRTSFIMINSSARPECKKGETAAMPYASAWVDVVIHPGVIDIAKKDLLWTLSLVLNDNVSQGDGIREIYEIPDYVQRWTRCGAIINECNLFFTIKLADITIWWLCIYGIFGHFLWNTRARWRSDPWFLNTIYELRL